MTEILEINKNNTIFKVYNFRSGDFWKKFQDSKWENEFFSNFDKIKDKNVKTFVDIGASDGPLTLYCASKVLQTVSIEPSNMVFDKLMKNVSLNDFKNINILHAAVGTENKKTKFISGEEFSDIMFLDEQEGGYDINMLELSKIIKEFNVKKFILKIDIEGYEFNLLSNQNFFKIIEKNTPELFLGVHIGFSSIFRYKKAKYRFLQKFYNLSKTFQEYKTLLKLFRLYKYIYVDGKKLNKLFFLSKKYYRKNFDIFLTNEIHL
tara:strand:- start:666 stop:1454 length:789 start_codon:yes stop_codon:yes gene_type:complete